MCYGRSDRSCVYGRVCIVRVLCVMAGLTGPVCIGSLYCKSIVCYGRSDWSCVYGRVCIVRVLCVMAGLTGPVKINMENA